MSVNFVIISRLVRGVGIDKENEKMVWIVNLDFCFLLF